MWIVRVALQRPYTFVVLALLILILGPLAILRTPKDIFPNIGIPVLSIVWDYDGLPPQELADRVVAISERVEGTLVNDIEHTESESLYGKGIVKVFFHPNVNLSTAMAESTAVGQRVIRQMPPGSQPPLIFFYNASTVPILQLALSGEGLSEQQVTDIAMNTLRQRLATVEGATIPWPDGGRVRQIQVDLDPAQLQARGLSPVDVVNAIGQQNLILPAGTVKIGGYEYDVTMNGSPAVAAELNNVPLKTMGDTTIYVRDVAHVRDGYPPQTEIARVNGQRASILTVEKSGNASTLDVIAQVKAALPHAKLTLPAALQIEPLADQSLFVSAAIGEVVREAVIAACLTALMILLFLGSWRSTLIIAVSIPLSILTSIAVLSALGETINIMTLGGLALAVGILVDDATVAIENINYHLEGGEELEAAILEGARQIAVPALVSTLAICIVFVPMFFLTGVAKYLFVPLAEAVVFAMLASYVLSRTLVPTMAKYMLKAYGAGGRGLPAPSRNPLTLGQRGFERWYQQVRVQYRQTLGACIARQRTFALCFLAVCVASMALVPWIGEDFFPSVDSGQFRVHLRAPTGTRIEDTAAICDRVEGTIRRAVAPGELDSIIDVIGTPYSSINLTYSTSDPVGPEDGDILVTLANRHRPTAQYVHDLRLALNREYPGVTFAFLPADIVSQILNFGLPSPIDIQLAGRDQGADRQFANHLLERLKYIPGLADLRIQQPSNQPELHVDVDRTEVAELGMSQKDVASDLLISLSGSYQTSPTFYLDPKNGVSYPVATQTPQYRIKSLGDLQDLPLTAAKGGTAQILGNVATISRRAQMGVVDTYDLQPVIDIYGTAEGRDLGGLAREINGVVSASRKNLPRGATLSVRGQIATMVSSFGGLLGGLAFAILLVYLLIVVNFQSWLDPFIIITALPAALAGIVWILFVTHTTISVPALTGAIMCMGVATANSILVVSFAKELLVEGKSPAAAAIEAGFTRFRPVLMTALAMIIGMVPMATGIGKGGEENAPLGRAVIGGLLFATMATLFFVPVCFSIFHKQRVKAEASLSE
ncbi:MAG TPA: efflux RND transporter permease subunit [Candidatus Acidoferrales bacterium]|nr:efflux RND transporter permease subunit [Candidatus Acidoferrales bacterium]